MVAMMMWDMCVCDDCSELYTTCVAVLFQVLLGRQGGGAGNGRYDTVGYVCVCDDCSVLYTTCVAVLFQVLLGRQGGSTGNAGYDTVGYVCL